MTPSLLLLAALAAGPTDAVSTEASPAPALPRYALSLEVGSLLWGGVELDGERYTANRRWSVLAGLGARWSGEANYSSFTLATGAELRFWLNRIRPRFMSDLGGPYASVRLDLDATHLHSRVANFGDWSGEIDASLRVGYRFVFRHRVELTPYVGGMLGSVVTDVPWLVAGDPQGGLLLGVTAGYMF